MQKNGKNFQNLFAEKASENPFGGCKYKDFNFNHPNIPGSFFGIFLTTRLMCLIAIKLTAIERIPVDAKISKETLFERWKNQVIVYPRGENFHLEGTQ